MKQRIRRFLILFVGLVIVGKSGPSYATDYDLTKSDFSGTATINGAIFTQMNSQSTGTGLINSFAQIGQPGGNQPIVDAYNTTVNNTLFNGQSDNFNHALQLSNVPTVSITTGNGANQVTTKYYEFNLDINQTGSNSKLTLDDVQIFLVSQANANSNTTNLATFGTPIYRMDNGGDNTVLLDYKLNSGSGSGDMTMLVPFSLFTGPNTSVVLYSHFGQDLWGTNQNNQTQYPNNDGFEEWFVCRNKTTGGTQACTGSTSGTNVSGSLSQSVPEPASMLLFGLGLVVGARRLSQQRRKH